MKPLTQEWVEKAEDDFQVTVHILNNYANLFRNPTVRRRQV